MALRWLERALRPLLAVPVESVGRGGGA